MLRKEKMELYPILKVRKNKKGEKGKINFRRIKAMKSYGHINPTISIIALNING